MEEVYYINDIWWGAEHNEQGMDSNLMLRLEIGEKKSQTI